VGGRDLDAGWKMIYCIVSSILFVSSFINVFVAIWLRITTYNMAYLIWASVIFFIALINLLIAGNLMKLEKSNGNGNMTEHIKVRTVEDQIDGKPTIYGYCCHPSKRIVVRVGGEEIEAEVIRRKRLS